MVQGEREDLEEDIVCLCCGRLWWVRMQRTEVERRQSLVADVHDNGVGHVEEWGGGGGEHAAAVGGSRGTSDHLSKRITVCAAAPSLGVINPVTVTNDRADK